MLPLPKQFKQLFLNALFMLAITMGYAQVKTKKQAKLQSISAQLADFNLVTAQAGVSFTFPAGFREIKALNNEDFTFDYAMDIPGHEFEVWYMVRSQKENWASYQRVELNQKLKLANPDSIYLDIGRAQAVAFTGTRDAFVRTLPPSVLRRYNADAGKSYLLNLMDMPETRHYQYALLISLQKFHTGTILMVCFTNNRTPEFYKNVERAGKCLKFKPLAPVVDKLAD